MKSILISLSLIAFLSTAGHASTIEHNQLYASDSIKEKNEKKTLGEYLIVVGSFSSEMDALMYFNQLCNNDVPAHFYYDAPNSKYLVHIGRYYFEQDAKAELRKNPFPALRKRIKKVKSYPQE